jgi:hypothetical protein
MVRLDLKGRGLELFHKDGSWIVVRPEPSLFHYDHSLGVEVLLAKDEVLQSVGFQLDHHRNPIRAEIFEISGVIARGEGVEIPSILLNDAGEFFRPHSWGPFEHHVFQDMRETCLPPRLVSGSHPIPNLEREQRSFVVLEKDDF